MMNLSDYTLELHRGTRSHLLDEVDDYIRAIAGNREYQYEAIRTAMLYLWGGGYTCLANLARENYQKKLSLRERDGFETEELLLGHLPLPDRLSGVVHMATGTGKSYVIFAVAYLSIVLGLVKRVLVLGPSSTIIEQGLRDKFKEWLNKSEWISKLPSHLQHQHITLTNANQIIGDGMIAIENINAVWSEDRNAIGDLLFRDTEEVLVLSDEVHHAYSHLKFNPKKAKFELEETKVSAKQTDDASERKWMQFLKSRPEIKRHLGFTGTPYDQKNNLFADIIVNYPMNVAIEDKFIKRIEPVIHLDTDSEFKTLTDDQRWQMILDTHEQNTKTYSYPDTHGNRRHKPITIFIAEKTASAEKNAEAFIRFLARHRGHVTDESLEREQVICVHSNNPDKATAEKLKHIEEIDTAKIGGLVEFIFAVNKLSEGWDVDNVFQIVPLESKAFESKLLISQVLGRGMRLPRSVPEATVKLSYPILRVTNHVKFAPVIKELLDAVINCENLIKGQVAKGDSQPRFILNFHLYNFDYIVNPKVETKQPGDDTKPPEFLELSPFNATLGVKVTRNKLEDRWQLTSKTYTVDEVVMDVASGFRYFNREEKSLGQDVTQFPSEKTIREKVQSAMTAAQNETGKLSEENRQQIELHFNQYRPRGKAKRIFVNEAGEINPVLTADMDGIGIRASRVTNDETTVFVSDDYQQELNKETVAIIDYLGSRPKNATQGSLFGMVDDFVRIKHDLIEPLGETKNILLVKPDVFKTPQNLVVTNHTPEKLFVYGLLEHHKWIKSWLKSRDMGFYAIDYEFWKPNKRRARRSFNPDFFVNIDVYDYYTKLKAAGQNTTYVQQLLDDRINKLIKVVETKGDEDIDEASDDKKKWATDHFRTLNQRMKSLNLGDLPESLRSSGRHYYEFQLIHERQIEGFFSRLTQGWVDLTMMPGSY